MAFQDIGCVADVLKSAAGASCDDSLVYQEFSVVYFIFQSERNFSVETDGCFLLYIAQDVIEVCFQLFNGINIARMERHRDHRFDLVEFYFYNAVIVSNRARIQLFVICASAVDLIELADLLIGSPDGGQTRCLGCHNVHTDPVICA